jgi:hypothetical protein
LTASVAAEVVEFRSVHNILKAGTAALLALGFAQSAAAKNLNIGIVTT